MSNAITIPGLKELPPNCWSVIGVWGDRTCPELERRGHCHNCPVFSQAGRQFLDTASPEGYLDEWKSRLSEPLNVEATDRIGVLVFRMGAEWLAMPVSSLVEVTGSRKAHRVPHRGGVLAGLVNIRGELFLLVRLAEALGLEHAESSERLLVIRRGAETWAFGVDEVDQVQRIAPDELVRPPATITRAVASLTRGVYRSGDRHIGVIDENRLFDHFGKRVR